MIETESAKQREREILLRLARFHYEITVSLLQTIITQSQRQCTIGKALAMETTTITLTHKI